MKVLLCVILGYTFGCLQTSYILVKRFMNTNVRSGGSGNAGTMNTFLNFNKTLGATVLFSDMLKTIIPCILSTIIFPNIDTNIVISYCSLGVIFGHCFPFWLGFRGGKGVAVAAAFALTLDFRVFFVSVIVAGLFGLILRSATYSSYTFAIMVFVCVAVFGYSSAVLLCVLIESLIIVLLHLRKSRKVRKA